MLQTIDEIAKRIEFFGGVVTQKNEYEVEFKCCGYFGSISPSRDGKKTTLGMSQGIKPKVDSQEAARYSDYWTLISKVMGQF